jgi:hypothetical protein
MFSENNHVSDTGIRHCMDTNIFCQPGSSLSSAEEVQISQDFINTAISVERQNIYNYQQIFFFLPQ